MVSHCEPKFKVAMHTFYWFVLKIYNYGNLHPSWGSWMMDVTYLNKQEIHLYSAEELRLRFFPVLEHVLN